ncbi:MAG: type VI secretion protein ImpB [Devosiaceae bacterium]
MERPQNLQTLYIDFDAFFAHVEKQLDPSLHGRPVGVTPLPSDYSGLIACCYQAKEAGVRRGMRVSDARALVPNIAIRPARHDVYVQQNKTIVSVIERFAPITKIWSIDEVECDIGRTSTDEAMQLGRTVRDALAATCGSIITPSIGLSCNWLLAKIAAEMDKPYGLVVLHPKDLPGRLLDIAIGDVPGVGRRMEDRLANAGITSMQSLLDISPKQARALWRSVEGERLILQLHGHETPRASTQRRMYGHGRILSGAWRQPHKAEECLHLLLSMAARRMRRDGFLATRLCVSIKTKLGVKFSCEEQFACTKGELSLLHFAKHAYRRCLQRGQSCQLRQIYVQLYGLQTEENRCDDLFAYADNAAANTLDELVSDAMDEVNNRYGNNTIKFGTSKQPPGGFAGTKIAFGRIPSLSDFDAS